MIARIGRIDAAELAADKASIVAAFRAAQERLRMLTLEEQLADTIPPAPPTLPAPPEKACSCGRTHDAFEWQQLPRLGVMGDDVERGELRNCACMSTLAVPLCIARGCNERASWVADTLAAYCGRHVDEFLMSEAAE